MRDTVAMAQVPSAHWKRSLAMLAIGIVAYLGITALVQDRYYQLVLTLVPIWATVGVAWNLFSGYSGLMSFGHAAFFGVGAYTVALLFASAGVSPWLGIPVAAVLGAVAGVIIGLPTFRLRGHYFALAMLAYPLAMLYVFEWLGLQEIALPMQRQAPALYMQFADQRAYVLVAVGLLAGALLVNLAIARSRFGLSLLAVKQNELAAMAAGIDPRYWKLRAIALSGALTAAAGGLYAVVLLIVTPPSVFGMLASAQALVVTLFGGIATVAGPVLGALILVPLSEILNAELGHQLPGIQGVVFGAAIALIVMIAPEGILPRILHARSRSRPRTGTTTLDTAPFLRTPSASGNPSAPDRALHLEVKGLSVAFGGLKALQDVTFDVARGEILGIIGPNGAGKTTLFNLLNGFTRATAGRVAFEGTEITQLPPYAICRAGVGRTFQVVRPFPRMSVLHNVVIGAFPFEREEAAAYARAHEAIARVGLSASAQAFASTLTTVESRLMEVARALASRPRLLLLDEILAGLGSEEVEHVLKVIDSVRRDGVTVVVIEHTMHAMVRLADRLLVLDHGRVLASGAPEAVTSEPRVIEAYLGKRWAARAAG